MGSKAPPPPDYMGMAQMQGQQSQELAQQQNYANRPNVSTPWGQQSWQATTQVDPTTGKQYTQWNENVGLSPQEQQSLDAQMSLQTGRSQAANDMLGQATSSMETPMDWSQLPQGGQSVNAGQLPYQQGYQSAFSFGQTPQSSSDYAQQAQQAIEQLQAPSLQHSRDMAESQMANQGVTMGSDAYNNQERNIGDNEDRAHLMAIQAGDQQAQNMFNQDLARGQFQNQTEAQDWQQGMAGEQFGNQAAMQQMYDEIAAGNYNNQNRNNAVSQEEFQRDQPLNEMNALMTGQQVGMPSFPGFAGATSGQTPNYMGATQSAYDAQVAGQNAQNAMYGNLAQSGAMAYLAYAMMA